MAHQNHGELEQICFVSCASMLLSKCTVLRKRIVPGSAARVNIVLVSKQLRKQPGCLSFPCVWRELVHTLACGERITTKPIS